MNWLKMILAIPTLFDISIQQFLNNVPVLNWINICICLSKTKLNALLIWSSYLETFFSWKKLIEINVSLMIDFWIQLVIVDIRSINLICAWTYFKYSSYIHAKFWCDSASPYFVHFVWTTSILLLTILKHLRENPEAK